MCYRTNQGLLLSRFLALKGPGNPFDSISSDLGPKGHRPLAHYSPTLQVSMHNRFVGLSVSCSIVIKARIDQESMRPSLHNELDFTAGRNLATLTNQIPRHMGTLPHCNNALS